MAVKSTLLEMVQDILEDIGGDEVNSITDTEEAETVAGHIKKTYNNLSSNSNWPVTRSLITLTPRSDLSFPTHMTINENVKKLEKVMYNVIKTGETDKNYQEIDYLDFEDFMVKTNSRKSSDSDTVVVIDDSGIELLIKNDKRPEYYTSIDQSSLIFDSYDSAVDSTLQESKLQAWGLIIPEFTVEDSFTPNLPPDAFSLLMEESISRCNFKMRQLVDQKSENESRKQSRWMSRQNWVVGGGIKYPNYGRRVK